jgi:hypothetical protein
VTCNIVRGGVRVLGLAPLGAFLHYPIFIQVGLGSPPPPLLNLKRGGGPSISFALVYTPGWEGRERLLASSSARLPPGLENVSTFFT